MHYAQTLCILCRIDFFGAACDKNVLIFLINDNCLAKKIFEKPWSDIGFKLEVVVFGIPA